MAVKIPRDKQTDGAAGQPRRVIGQVDPRKEEIKQLLRGGMSLEDCITQFPSPSEKTIRRYFKEVQDEKAGKVTEGKDTAGTRVVNANAPAQFAVVTTRAPGPIVFRMGGEEIDLNPSALYDAFRYCQDIKRIEPSIDDDFSSMLKIATKRMWDYFSQREARRVGVDLELVKEN